MPQSIALAIEAVIKADTDGTMSQAASLTDEQLENLLRIDYLDVRALPGKMADYINRLEIWRACLRLKIPRSDWPIWGRPLLLPGPTQAGGPSMGIAGFPLTFTLPAFDLTGDSHRTWKAKVLAAWREFQAKEFGPYLKRSTANRRVFTASRMVRFSGEKRDDAMPINLRYDLAVLRHCCGKTWPELATHAGLGRERIRKAVTTILRSAGLLTEPRRA
jgi:hypothetical protein